MPSKPSILLATTVLGLALTACGSDTDAEDTEDTAKAPASSGAAAPSETPTRDNQPTGERSDDPAEAPAGQLVSWDDYESDPAAYAGSDVVLYFHADWCHECQATDAAIEADGIPDGLTLVKIDYDDRTDLRQRYGVTVQHTFVLVDGDGERRDAWTETTSGAEIADRAA